MIGFYTQKSANATYTARNAYRQVLLRPSSISSCQACSVTWLAIMIMFPITVRSLRYFTLYFVSVPLQPMDS